MAQRTSRICGGSNSPARILVTASMLAKTTVAQHINKTPRRLLAAVMSGGEDIGGCIAELAGPVSVNPSAPRVEQEVLAPAAATAE